MKTIIKIHTLAKPAILGTIIALSGLFISTAQSATPIGTDFTAEQRLKLSRLASKNRQNVDLGSYIELGNKRDDAFDENNADCGNIEIGNVESPRPGQSVQPIDVFIVGDVINVPEGC